MKQSEENLMVIENFIDYYTSDDVERSSMKMVARDYIREDHIDGEESDDDFKWLCTDPSHNQYRKDTDNPMVFLFKEDRLINPITKEIEHYQAEIDLNDYTIDEIVDACSPFGYEVDDVIRWYSKNMNLDLIAECIFEQDMDNY